MRNGPVAKATGFFILPAIVTLMIVPCVALLYDINTDEHIVIH